MSDTTTTKLEVAIGTLAHNRSFSLRELVEYVRFDGINARTVRTHVDRWKRTGHLEIVDVAPVRYAPSRAMWDVIGTHLSTHPLTVV